MTLDDLEPHERLAFAGLVRMMVRADGVLSPAESAALSTLAREVGSMRFWRCMTEAQQALPDKAPIPADNPSSEALPDMEDLSDAARNVERQPIREWIYEVLMGMAAADGNIGDSEGRMLDWLRALWGL